jgi:hypothetical protein
MESILKMSCHRRAYTYLGLAFLIISESAFGDCMYQSRREQFDAAEQVFQALLLRKDPTVMQRGVSGELFPMTPLRYVLIERYKGAPPAQGVVYNSQGEDTASILPKTNYLIYMLPASMVSGCASFSFSELTDETRPKVTELPELLSNLREWSREPGMDEDGRGRKILLDKRPEYWDTH